jgi:fructokinase
MKVFTIGETVLDIIFKDNQPVSAKAGGSVLNSSVSLGRLGVDVYFISDYGSDQVGNLIDDFLRENHVNTSKVVRFKEHKSALALAFLNENNDASYTFYKDFPEKRLPGLSVNFSKEDYLLFGSFFAITDSVRDSLLKILNDAREAGSTIIYDPNFRRPHLHELETVKPWILQNIGFADLVKGSDEDFELIFGATGPEEAYESVWNAGCSNLIYTSGPKEVVIRTLSVNMKLPVPSIKTVSTIGAGDNFNAGLVWSLYKENIHKEHINDLAEETWKKIAGNGILFASEVCRNYDNYISEEFAFGLLNDRGSK